DLSRFKGSVPMELFGQTDFPQIGELPYFLTVGPYAFYWFQIQEKSTLESGQWLLKQPVILDVDQEQLRTLSARENWKRFERNLRSYLPKARWFAGKGRKISKIELSDLLFVKQYERQEESGLALINVTYSEGLSELYSLPLSFADGERAERVKTDKSDMVIAETATGIFYEAILDGAFDQAMLELVLKKKSVVGKAGKIQSEFVSTLPTLAEGEEEIPSPTLAGLEQSNSSMLFGKRYYLKMYRKFEEGENPEIEIGRFFAKKGYTGTAPYLGSLSYSSGGKVYSLAVVQQLVENESDGWTLMLSQVSQLSERLISEGSSIPCTTDLPNEPLSVMRTKKPSEDYQQLAGYTLRLATMLGHRTAEMHLALGVEDRDSAFIPEPHTPFY
ncbi:MAG: hypothetical protein EOP05_20250, partial [Proteobacteria bacterium]